MTTHLIIGTQFVAGTRAYIREIYADGKSEPRYLIANASEPQPGCWKAYVYESDLTQEDNFLRENGGWGRVLPPRTPGVQDAFTGVVGRIDGENSQDVFIVAVVPGVTDEGFWMNKARVQILK